MRLKFLSLGMLAGLFMACTSNDKPTAGITTIGNTVAGVVVDSKNELVVNAEVRLIGGNYNPVLDPTETGYRLGHTDEKGKYFFEKVEKGSYNVEAIRDGGGAFVKGIQLENGNGSGTVPNAMLTKPGAITIVFGTKDVQAGSAYFIPGTTRLVRVDSTARRIGLVTMQYVATGLYTSLHHILPGSTVGINILPMDFLQVIPDDTLVLSPYAPWKQVRRITINTSATGANLSTNLTDFPLLLRLNASNFDFRKVRKDGADIRFMKGNGVTLDYSVQTWDSLSSSAEVWVKLDTVFGANASQSFMLFSGNEDSLSRSQGSSVFTKAAGFNGIWHLDGLADLQDESIGNHKARNHGAVAVNGVMGKAAHFAGTAWMDMPVEAFRNIGRKISISFWQNADDTLKPDNAYPFGGINAAGLVQLSMHGPYGNTLVSWTAGSLDSAANRDRIGKLPDAEAQKRSQWNQWTLTKDADKGEMKMFLNGKVWASEVGKTTSIDSLASFVLSFQGTEAYAIDEFTVSNLTRTDDWVKLTYETQKLNATAVKIGK
jgi:hypothetical protein